MVWYSHHFKNFPLFVVIHTVKDFGIVIEAEVDVFLEFSCFFYDPSDVGFLDWKIPRQRSLVDYSPWAHKRVRHNLVTKQQHYSEFVMADVKKDSPEPNSHSAFSWRSSASTLSNGLSHTFLIPQNSNPFLIFYI